MPKQPKPAHNFDPPVWAVFDLLLDGDPEHPYAVPEIARKVGGIATTADALVILEAAGLIRRSGEMVHLTNSPKTGG